MPLNRINILEIQHFTIKVIIDIIIEHTLSFVDSNLVMLFCVSVSSHDVSPSDMKPGSGICSMMASWCVGAPSGESLSTNWLMLPLEGGVAASESLLTGVTTN